MKQKALCAIAIATVLVSGVSSNHQTKSNTTNMEKEMRAVQVRIARPTNNLLKVVKFYQEGLGLTVLGKFEDHLGYDGVMLGMPDKTYHLEFTQHMDKEPLPEPTKENLLVFYFDSPEEYQRANERIQKLGIVPVEPENPYWKGKSETYEDPDRWRVILFNGTYNP
ncbi:VOC family protein [Sphingobacterium paucimobilis]|uniref:VOC domain-containing protein n=1 Tax=Sphingobacterium paucimobilis HER1398 TaxID=1346330 RepID=U2HTW0_9SPHI|nr:VOC family protein [Sphingobacterium paucimobilis]ERJ58715.1 hypothetical protein M472_08035 [Sphingobacterium paucimobilis HER1398]